jgi:ATP dependent DNA ligase domain
MDWTRKYPVIGAALSALSVKQAYLDGELCGIRPDGKTSFSLIQTASDTGNAGALVFFLFDLLYLDGEAISAAPLRERKERLRDLLSNVGEPLQYSDQDRTRPGVPCEGLRVVAGGHHRQARGCALLSRRSQVVDEGQVPESLGVRGGRLDRSRRCGSVARCAAPGVLIQLVGSFMLAASGPELARRSSSGYGGGCNLSPPPRCRRRCRPLARTGLARRSSSAACTGFGPSLWSRSNI